MHGQDQERVAVITFNDIPPVNTTHKYQRLGRMALDDRQHYCARHGYAFISDVPIARDRPACWAKIPAILDAFQAHDWVLWADSDTLIHDHAMPIERFIDQRYDLIVQSHDPYFRFVGIPVAEGNRKMPINTGVFLIRATDWSRDFLTRAYQRSEFITHNPIWDGIGEQEAMIAELQARPIDLERIQHVDDLQAPPKFHRLGTLFLHFYGNHARQHIPDAVSTAIIDRWERTVTAGQALPQDMTRFHWSCIQNRDPHAPALGGDLPRYLYRPEDLRESG